MRGHGLAGVNKTERMKGVRNMGDGILAKKDHQGLNLTTAVTFRKLYKYIWNKHSNSKQGTVNDERGEERNQVSFTTVKWVQQQLRT